MKEKDGKREKEERERERERKKERENKNGFERKESVSAHFVNGVRVL